MTATRRLAPRRRAERRGAQRAPVQRTRRRAREGFTLISMIVAIVLLTVGILALGDANVNTIKYQTMAQNRTNAVAIARAYLEEVRSRNPWNLTSEAPVQVGVGGVASVDAFYTRKMDVTEVRGNLLQIDLYVDFPRAERPVKLTTYQYRGNGLSGSP